MDVEFCGIHKSFDSNLILAGIDLRIESGEFVALVGPSGCGKSTLLRILAGLEDTDKGEVRIGGEKVNDVGPDARGVSMVFQSYALYPHMSVRENLEFPLKMKKVDGRERNERIAEVAKMLDLSELLDRKPAQLSGGQKQRVAMGRAIARRPKVLLFDEPLSNLDAQLRGRVRAEIHRLHREYRSTVLYVTHDQIEAMTLADRIAILNKGRLEQVGAPLSVFREPQTQFVASFIGTPPTNFLPAASVPGARAKTVGFRPENVRLDGRGQSLGEGIVTLVEPLGTLAHVHADLQGDLRGERVLIERRTEECPAPGDRVQLSVEPSHFLYFDADGARA